jgi:hypothetical protein
MGWACDLNNLAVESAVLLPNIDLHSRHLG